MMGSKLNMGYNGWKNRETWLVNIWYVDDMVSIFSDCERYHIKPCDLADEVEHLIYAETQPIDGLLGDFISTCWAEVDWHELADAMNEQLAAMRNPLPKVVVQ